MNKRRTLKSGLSDAASAVAEAPPTQLGQLDLEIGQGIERSTLTVSYDAAEPLPESIASDAESMDAVAADIEPVFNAASEERG